MDQVIVNVRQLTKEFKDVLAVQDLSFTVKSGQVYGFLGQNGAGKSTTIRMLLTLIKPSSGDIEIFGMDLRKHRKEILRRVGAIIERPDLYKYLTALENIRLFAAMSGKRLAEKKLMSQLDMVGLADRAMSKVGTYSQGMKQRLGIAIALVHDPDLIILDEPTNGLDPQGIADVRNLILNLSSQQNKTLIISSHLLSEIELIADSMLIIHKGKKIVEGNVRELLDPAESIVELKTTDDQHSLTILKNSTLAGMIHGSRPDGLLLKLRHSEIPGILEQIVNMNVQVLSFYSTHSLEDYFLSLTGNSHVVPAEN